MAYLDVAACPKIHMSGKDSDWVLYAGYTDGVFVEPFAFRDASADSSRGSFVYRKPAGCLTYHQKNLDSEVSCKCCIGSVSMCHVCQYCVSSALSWDSGCRRVCIRYIPRKSFLPANFLSFVRVKVKTSRKRVPMYVASLPLCGSTRF